MDYSKKVITSHLLHLRIALVLPCDDSRMTFNYSVDTRGLQHENHSYRPATTGTLPKYSIRKWWPVQVHHAVPNRISVS